MKPFFFRKLFHERLQNNSSRIRFGIDRMANAVDQSCMVECVLAQQAFQITGNLFFVRPVLYFLLHILEHLHYLDVRTAVTGTLQGADGSSHYGIGIRQRGGYNMGCKGGVIAAAVLHVQNHTDIQDSGFQWGIRAVGTQDMEDIFRHGPFGHRLMDEETVAVMIMAVSLVSVDG